MRRAGLGGLLVAILALALPAAAPAGTLLLHQQVDNPNGQIETAFYHGFLGRLNDGDDLLLVFLKTAQPNVFEPGVLAIKQNGATDTTFGTGGFFSFLPLATNEEPIAATLWPNKAGVDLFSQLPTGAVQVRRDDLSGHQLNIFTFLPPPGVDPLFLRGGDPAVQGPDRELLLGGDLKSGNALLDPFGLTADGVPSIETYKTFPNTGSASNPSFVEALARDPLTGNFVFTGSHLTASGMTFLTNFQLFSTPPDFTLNSPITNFIRGNEGARTDVGAITFDPNGQLYFSGKFDTAPGEQGFLTKFGPSPGFSPQPSFADTVLPPGPASFINKVYYYGPNGDLIYVGDQPLGTNAGVVVGAVKASTGAPDGPPVTFSPPGGGKIFAEDAVLNGTTIRIFSALPGGGVDVADVALQPPRCECVALEAKLSGARQAEHSPYQGQALLGFRLNWRLHCSRGQGRRCTGKLKIVLPKGSDFRLRTPSSLTVKCAGKCNQKNGRVTAGPSIPVSITSAADLAPHNRKGKTFVIHVDRYCIKGGKRVLVGVSGLTVSFPANGGHARFSYRD